jgi:glycosyltransferase involved in cell wall biosynthesis
MQGRPHNVSIIIPVFNEERRLEKCLQRTLDYFNNTDWDFEIIIANDASSDKTADIIERFSRANSSIKILSFTTRQGKGLSLKKAAFSSTKEYVGYMDADLAAEPCEFERLIKFIGDYDIAIGSRLMREGLPPIERPMYRSFLSHGYSLLFRSLFRVPICDPQCGFKLFKRQVLLDLCDHIYNDGYVFDAELVVRAIRLGYRVKEVPINWRHIGNSKIRAGSQIIAMGNDLLSLWYNIHKGQPQPRTTLEIDPVLPN